MARQAEQWPDAIAHFSQAAKLDTNFADALIGLGRALLAADRAADAIPPLEQAVKLQPANPATHFHLATAYRRAGRRADADREFLAHKETTEKARQSADDLKKALSTGQGDKAQR
jgi:Flp pilus assembly protein TadD